MNAGEFRRAAAAKFDVSPRVVVVLIGHYGKTGPLAACCKNTHRMDD